MRLLGPGSLSSLLESILLVAWIGCWLIVAAFVLIPLLGLERTSFTFPAQISHGLAIDAEGPGGAWNIKTAVAQISTPHDRTWIGSLVAVPFLALIALVLGELRAIFRSLRDGSPFIAENARRLRRVGLGVLGYEALRVVVTIAVVGPALESLRTGAAVVQANAWPDWHVLFWAFAVLVLAEVFRRGAAMRDEQALTV